MRMRTWMASAIVLALTLSACSDDDTTSPEPQEFVATEADFAGYLSWEQTTDPRVGVDPSNILAGGAHGATDENVVRSMFVSPTDAQRTDNEQYPVGTLFAKEMKGGDGNVIMITAMAKRGNNFDSEGNDWEYLTLDATGAITDRGADLFGGACKACHTGAKALDYVFTR